MSRPPELRVLHVSRFFHPRAGGTENHIAELAAHVAKHGIVSSIVTTDRGRSERGPVPQIAVHTMPVVGPDWMPVPRGAFAMLAREIGHSDIVHVHDLRFAPELLAFVSHVQSAPLVVSSHGFIFHTSNRRALKEIAWRTYYRRLLERCTMVVCVSHADAEHCRRLGSLDSVRVIPNPVQLDPFRGTPSRTRRGSALLYFGRLDANKGIERLAPVLARAPADWTLTIAGRGDRAFVSTLAKLFDDAIGERCRFRLGVDQGALVDLFASHDCVVLPATAEGFGLALVEAMASGIPTVASDIPPFREIAAGSPVRLIDFDRDDVVDAIANTIATWDDEDARARAETFSWERRGSDFVKLYRSLAGE